MAVNIQIIASVLFIISNFENSNYNFLSAAQPNSPPSPHGNSNNNSAPSGNNSGDPGDNNSPPSPPVAQCRESPSVESAILDCNKTSFTAVYGENPPYAFTSADGANCSIGSVNQVVTEAIAHCCGSDVKYSIEKTVLTVRDVEEHIENLDLAFPVVKTGLLLNTGVRTGYIFLPVMETTGAVILLKPNGKEANVVGESLMSCWPLALIVLFSALLAGVIVWILDRSLNDVDFPKSYLQGSWEGTWWAFVTMTTVGYGDKAPKSAPARCFGLIWMFIGIILMSIFTATLTTALSADQTAYFEIKGASVAAIAGSMEEVLAYKEGAAVTAVPGPGPKAMIDAIHNNKVEAGLIDINLALYSSELLTGNKLRLGPVIENRAAYGIIVQNQNSAVENCLARQVSQYQFKVYDELTEYRGRFRGKNRNNIASETTEDVLSNLYTICIVLASLWVVALAGCIAWEFAYYRPKTKQLKNKVFSIDNRDTAYADNTIQTLHLSEKSDEKVRPASVTKLQSLH